MIKEYRTMPLEMITKEIFKQHYQKAKRKSFIQSVEMSILLKKEDIMLSSLASLITINYKYQHYYLVQKWQAVYT